MATMTAKRRETLAKVSKLQKRARDKEWHLRKRGAVGIRIGSPRLNFSETRGMTTKQLQAYARRLETFNRTKLTVLESGDVAKTSDLNKIKKNIRKYNKKVSKERKRFEARQKERAAKGQTTYREFPLEEVKYRQPTTAEQSERLEKKSRKWANRDPHRLSKSHRRSAVEMLKAVGLDAEARKIRNMKTEDFEELVENYGLLDDVSLWYRPDMDVMQRQIKSNPDDFAIFARRTSMAIKSYRERR